MPSPYVEIDAGRHTVKVTNPEKVYFSALGSEGGRKIDLVQYYLAVADGIVRALRNRPTYLKRHIDGAESDPIYQKRIPDHRPPWIETARVTFPSGRHADALCVTGIADVQIGRASCRERV